MTATVTRNTSTTRRTGRHLGEHRSDRGQRPGHGDDPGRPGLGLVHGRRGFRTACREGMQQVQISATTTGLDTGLATLGITDVQTAGPGRLQRDVPRRAATTTRRSPFRGPSPTAATIPRRGSWVDEVFLDPAGGSESTTPVDSLTFTGSLNPGQSYTQNVTIQSPSSVGQYFVRVVTDSGDSVQELSYTNNTGVAGQPLQRPGGLHRDGDAVGVGGFGRHAGGALGRGDADERRRPGRRCARGRSNPG